MVAPAGRVALTHLADTSVLKRLGNVEVRRAVEPMLIAGEIARAGICDLAVGYSARDTDEWDSLIGAIQAFGLVETTAQHVRRALQVQRMLAAGHQRGRKIPDLLIAAAAEASDLVVLHYDADFDRIATVTSQRCRWVVPAGSVD